MSLLRWLWPGIGVKRWIALFAAGVILVSLGLTVVAGPGALRSVGDWLRNAAYLLTGSTLTPLLRALLLVAPGVAMMAAAVGGFVRAVIHVLIPGGGDVTDLLYQRKYLERGPRVVAVGGGTGLGTLLRGLKLYTSNITAIVTVTDDGGSSGRLRGELGLPPPGDIRNCLVALADTEPLMESLFQHRFSRGGSLEGHSFGNLFIAAMAEVTGDFEEAVRESSRVLAIRGRVLPSTKTSALLRAEFTDGTTVLGETAIAAAGKAIARVYLEPPDSEPLPESLEAIAAADLIVLGPGSVYSSVVPNLLVRGIAEAIASSPATVVYVANIMTQAGETDGYGVAEHLEAVVQHAGRQLVHVVVENDAPVDPSVLAMYAAERSMPVPPSRGEVERRGVRVVRGPLVAAGPLARHDPFVLAQVITRLLSRKQSGLGVGWSGFLWLAEHLHLRRTKQTGERGSGDRV
jgi:uncharacterized cofD-like protein